MSYDPEIDPNFEPVIKRAFPAPTAKAPAFLWTRVLAAIEAQEELQSGLWWRQWRWMSRMAAVATLVISLSAGWVFYQTEGNLDPLLHGITTSQQEAQLLNDQTAAFDIARADFDTQEGESWAQN